MQRKIGIIFFILFFVSKELIAIAALPREVISKEVTLVEGFRSAKFGMTENEIYGVIENDFAISKGSVQKTENIIDKTTSLTVTVPKLLAEGGQARVFYILGYRSKKLIQINVIWGNPFEPNPNRQAIVNTANVLKEYFLRKGFNQDDLLIKARLKDGSVVVFRGTDSKGRMVFLLLKMTSKKPENQGENKELSLRLSYIENPNDPDIFKIKDGEF